MEGRSQLPLNPAARHHPRCGKFAKASHRLKMLSRIQGTALYQKPKTFIWRQWPRQAGTSSDHARETAVHRARPSAAVKIRMHPAHPNGAHKAVLVLRRGSKIQRLPRDWGDPEVFLVLGYIYANPTVSQSVQLFIFSIWRTFSTGTRQGGRINKPYSQSISQFSCSFSALGVGTRARAPIYKPYSQSVSQSVQLFIFSIWRTFSAGTRQGGRINKPYSSVVHFPHLAHLFGRHTAGRPDQQTLQSVSQ